MNVPRVAFFADSFHEVNGVALTCRQFDDFAARRRYPFFSVHSGPKTGCSQNGGHETYELNHSRLAIGLERDLSFDLIFARHLNGLRKSLERFQPDLIHVTGPSHIGLLGAVLSRQLNVPLSASWHTNLHEYAAQRLDRKLTPKPAWLTASQQSKLVTWAGRRSLQLTMRFYQLARLHFAPNPELLDLLTTHTGLPAHLMERGIDTHLFSPAKRQRNQDDQTFVIGFVGRISPEKNVRLLAQIEQRLIESGIRDYKFLLVGDGSERGWLTANLQRAEFTGVLTGESLARAYANMDAFVFPSETDTFGNVVLEAMASRVPVLVSKGGGPKFLVRPGANGFIATTAEKFADALMDLRSHRSLRERMAGEARATVLSRSWDSVFERIYARYAQLLDTPGVLGKSKQRSAERFSDEALTLTR